MFWSTIRNEIKQIIDTCSLCQKYPSSQTSEPLITHEIPAIPWYKVGCDIFEIRGIHYLIAVDYYSKYVEVEKLNTITSCNVINIFKKIFSRFGVPRFLVSDGETQFTADQLINSNSSHDSGNLNTLLRHRRIVSLMVSMSERHIQTVKKMIKKVIEDNKDLYLALLQYRNTPIFGNNSPSEILISRATRNPLLPTKIDKLKPHLIDEQSYNQFIRSNLQKQTSYYNRKKGVKELSVLQPNS